MNSKVMMIISVTVAVLAAAVSAIVVTNNRAALARAQAAKAESREAAAASEARKAKAEESAQAQRAAAKEAEAKAAEENRKAREAERATAELTAKAEAEAKEKARLEAEKARSEAQAAADARAEAKSKETAAKVALESLKVRETAEIAKSNALAQAASEHLAAEKLRNDAIIAEAKLLELRKIDFETAERDLMELQQELAERERALTPDKTSADLVWVGEREPDEIGGGTNAVRRLKRKSVRTEDDPSLPRSTRRLARTERELQSEIAAVMGAASNTVVKTLTRLYVQALRDDRLIDAQFYRQSIKHYYPNWEYKP